MRQCRAAIPLSRLRTVGAIVIAAVSFGLLAGTASATVHTYFGPAHTAYYGFSYQSGFNYPQTNRVYRPLYHYFTLYYTDGQYAWGYKRNYWDNPMIWPYPGGYARSACGHSDDEIQDPQYPVTCQYIT